jgi:hypothetical protein
VGKLLRRAQRQPAGVLIITGPDGRAENMDTVQCAHCGAHWVPEPGSGRERGWCFKHAGPLCGAAQCFTTCASQEQLIERIEAAARMAANLRLLRD